MDLSSGGEFADSETLTGRDRLLQRVVVSELAHTANSRQSFNRLIRRLIRLAEHAFSVRDASTLHEASLILLNLPIAEARQIGRYYQALAVRRSGKIDESLPLFERLADNGPLAYRARALQTLGAIYHKKGRLDESLRLYPEAARAASPENGRDLMTTLLVNQEIACIKSEIGDHRGAFADYEKLSPLVHLVSRQNPLYFYFYHNEIAVELAELGRLAEAEAACAIALASPFAHAYPEWRATRDEIAEKRQSVRSSVVAVNRAPGADASRAEPQRQQETSAAIVFRPPTNRNSYPITSIRIPARTTNVLNAASILDQMLVCIGPRAPPASFGIT